MTEDPETDGSAASDEAAATAEPLILRSPAHFKALGHPVRHRIVNALRQRPATLGQLASAMGLAKGTISFHVRILREAGLVRLADTRHVRGGTEQYFALISDAFRPDGTGGPQFLVQAALAEMLPGHDDEGHTALQHMWLSQRQARALAARIEEWVRQEDAADSGEGEPFGLLVSLYRADIPKLPRDGDDNG